MLAKHFGDIVKASKELGVDRTDLRKLTWHNPKILAASHERMQLFRLGVRDKIISAIYSRSASRRRWGFDAFSDSYEFRGSPLVNAGLVPASRARPGLSEEARGRLARSRLAREAVAELEREAALERDREAAADRGEVRVERRPPVGRVFDRAPARGPELMLASRPEKSPVGWPAWIRRPTRGRR